VRPARTLSSTNEVLRCDFIALAAPGAVDNCCDTVNGRVNPTIEKKIPGYKVDTVFVLAGLPREDANIVSGLTQPAHDMTAERTRAACN
jgi:hypothetical protein